MKEKYLGQSLPPAGPFMDLLLTAAPITLVKYLTAMSKNIVKPLSQAQICGEGLRVIGEGIRKKQVWGDKLSFVLVEIILGAKGEDVIPVLSPADMEALKAALTFSCQKVCVLLVLLKFYSV